MRWVLAAVAMLAAWLVLGSSARLDLHGRSDANGSVFTCRRLVFLPAFDLGRALAAPANWEASPFCRRYRLAAYAAGDGVTYDVATVERLVWAPWPPRCAIASAGCMWRNVAWQYNDDAASRADLEAMPDSDVLAMYRRDLKYVHLP